MIRTLLTITDISGILARVCFLQEPGDPDKPDKAHEPDESRDAQQLDRPLETRAGSQET